MNKTFEAILKENRVKVLGKIRDIRIGYGGYDDAMFGVSFWLDNEHGTCGDFWGGFPMKCEGRSDKFKEGDMQILRDTFIKLNDYMDQAKVTDAMDLKGKPIEVELDNMKLVSWRILTEVI
jgi:hypothetical protein